MKEQIEEMKEVVCDVLNFDICNKFDRCDDCPTAGIINALYNAGYRKQKEGEWKPSPSGSTNVYCSLCGAMSGGGIYCSHCGAKMKGGAE